MNPARPLVSNQVFSVSRHLKLTAMFTIIVRRIIPMPRAMAVTNTVFNRPTKGRAVMASAGRSQRAGITSSKPKTLPKRKPKMVEQNPQQEMMAARSSFLNR